MERPDWVLPARVLVCAAATRAWYEASDEERESTALVRYKAVLEAWERLGAQLVASFDDDLLTVGEPMRSGWSMYLIYEVRDIGTVVKMIDLTRDTCDGVRLDRYIRMEAHLGRHLFLLER
jgi:hypothetical protein